MMVPLTQLEVIAMRPALDQVLSVLQELRLAEVVALVEPGGAPPGLTDLIARADALCALVDLPASGSPMSDDVLQTTLDGLEPVVVALLAEAEDLRNVAETLPRSIAALDAVQPLVPELGRLNDRQLANLGLASMALVLDDPDLRVVRELARHLADLLGRAHLLAYATAGPGTPVGCLIVLRRDDLSGVNALLGQERIAEVGVPADFAGRSLRATIEAMRERLAALPRERMRVQGLLVDALSPAVGPLRVTAQSLRMRAERLVAAQRADVSARTFRLRLWVPARRAAMIERTLTERAGPTVAVEHLVEGDLASDQPVLLRNRPGWQPFQQLVGFLSWPARGGLDPTGLMALVLPIFFGIMVGDVVYGAMMMAAAWWLRTHGAHDSTRGAVGRVLTLGGAWAMLFGLLYGEALGSLGHRVGMPALWVYRGGPTALEPLLLFSLAVGLVHVTLGLLLGAWTAVRRHRRRHLASKTGTLLALAGVAGLAGARGAGSPADVALLAAVLVITGLVLASATQGALGLLTGPLELLGTLGNVLSYLRLAALGLASTYLAEVANELGTRGPLLLGVLTATLFHALNLTLAAFSPMIQALRLHYVEFFGQFHEGGGRLFSPLGGAVALTVGAGRGAVPPAVDRTIPQPVPAGSSS
jgi:V/A-type H+-transporting ATPase subunit I